eukprot:TRINITY_DN2562_c0_g1_i1.p1 TRINITY_DN2562_c0_g1~~TRINITY_DN2562_c0_g1_i1.p1  ORF type:complete len:427 (+),score=82.60 TRINITY_DN2562_c0_g1_i1:22-1281(+)
MSVNGLGDDSMRCPFFQRTYSKIDESLIRDEFLSFNHMEMFQDEMTVREFVELLVSALKLDRYPEFNANIDRIVLAFESNWIFSWRQIKMLDVDKVRKLDIPAFLENEIERAIIFYTKQVEVYAEEVDPTRVYHDPATALLSAQKYTKEDGEMVQSTWKSFDSTNENVGFEFAETFYSRFFDRSPVGKRLFVTRPIQDQARTLFNIINWIANNLQNREKLTKYIKRLGGRHTLYGVTANDYIPFIEEFIETLDLHLGSDVITEDVKKGWSNVMRYCAKQMLEGSQKYDKGVCFEALLGDTEEEVQRSYLKLTLDRLIICKDNSYSEYSRQFTLNGLNSIELINESQFLLSSGSPPFTLILGADDKKKLKSLVKRFTWRIRALQRLFSEEASSEGDSDSLITITKNLNNGLNAQNEEDSI